MKATKLNIAKHTTGSNGGYSVKIEVFEGQTCFEFNSIDGYLQRITERYQDCGHKDFETVDNNINNKKEFVDAVKWQLKNTKEVNFL